MTVAVVVTAVQFIVVVEVAVAERAMITVVVAT